MRRLGRIERLIDFVIDEIAAPLAGAHLYDLVDRERERDLHMLRQHGAAQRKVARLEGRDGLVGKPDRAAIRLQFAGEDVQQCRFAGAVGTDNGNDLAVRHAQTHAIEDRVAAARQRNVQRLKHD